MSDQKPREFLVSRREWASGYVVDAKDDKQMEEGDTLHVIEATPRTLAAEEMYEALRFFLYDMPKGEWNNDRITVKFHRSEIEKVREILAKAGKND